MEELLKKYPVSPDQQKIPFTHPEFTMDLHGYTQEESRKKLDWISRYLPHKKHATIKIVTGKGTGVLRALVHKTLVHWHKKGEIMGWREESVGSFVYIS